MEPQLSLGLFDFGASYVVVGQPPARGLRTDFLNEEFPVSLDLYLGGRYTYLEAKADSTYDDKSTGTAGGDASFVDPLIGARFHFPIAETVLLLARGDIGGFGAGSQLSSNFAAGLHWSVERRLALNFVYRFITIDYRSGREADEIWYKLTHQGLIVGVTYIF